MIAANPQPHRLVNNARAVQTPFDCTALARQVLIQSSSSSRARSKRVMNQTVFDVPDPLIVHVLLLTHKVNV